MRAVFARHIAKVEAALQELPNSHSFWNVWGWMARSLENRDWKRLLRNINAFTFPGGLSCPAPNVATWLLKEAKATGDWEQVVELAKAGMGFVGYTVGEASWVVGGWMDTWGVDAIEGYPVSSALIPMLEGLLRLNRLEEANRVFEDILFFGGEGTRETLIKLAQDIGHPNLARDWSAGVPDKSVPRHGSISNLGVPGLIHFKGGEAVRTPTSLRVIPGIHIFPEKAKDVFGWSENDERWALMDATCRLVVQGEGVPSEEIIFEELKKMGYRTKAEQAREFLRENPSNTYAHYVLATEIGINAGNQGHNTGTLDDETDFELWNECARQWQAYYENPLVPMGLRNIVTHRETAQRPTASNSHLMKAVAEKVIPRLEVALRQQPMSHYLWGSWIAWRRTEGDTRSIAALLADLEPSPLEAPASFPPPMVMDAHYKELSAQEKWAEVAKLLRQLWERDLARIDVAIKRGQTPRLGAQTMVTGRSLIKTLLQDGRTNDAEDVFDAWVSRGGRFSGMDEIVELARKMGYGTLAEKMENK
jgi:hypothetical protein